MFSGCYDELVPTASMHMTALLVGFFIGCAVMIALYIVFVRDKNIIYEHDGERVRQ